MFIYLSALFLSLIYLVLTSVNPFVCLMYLVLIFIIGCLLTLSMGLEYLSLIVLLVYVGALAVLFLFVIMLLDIKAALFYVMSTKPNFSQLGLLVILFSFLLDGIDFVLDFNYSTDYILFATLFDVFGENAFGKDWKNKKRAGDIKSAKSILKKHFRSDLECNKIIKPIGFRKGQFFRQALNMVVQTTRFGKHMSDEAFEAYMRKYPQNCVYLGLKVPFSFMQDNKFKTDSVFVNAYVYISSKHIK